MPSRTPPADGPAMPEPFTSEHQHAITKLRSRHRHLTETLTRMPALTQEEQPPNNDRRPDAPPAAMREVLVAAREFACAAEPLIMHLPAIIAALEEAADYRDYYGWCADCSPQPDGSRCADHARDQAVRAAYEAARHAIIGLTA